MVEWRWKILNERGSSPPPPRIQSGSQSEFPSTLAEATNHKKKKIIKIISHLPNLPSQVTQFEM